MNAFHKYCRFYVRFLLALTKVMVSMYENLGATAFSGSPKSMPKEEKVYWAKHLFYALPKDILLCSTTARIRGYTYSYFYKEA